MTINPEDMLWKALYAVSPRAHQFAFKRRMIARYIIAGGTAAAVNLSLLYFFTDILGFWYVISAVMAFIAAFVVSFCFQKFWTFEDRSTEGVHAQAAVYLMVAVLNLIINTALIYSFVEFLAVHYLLAQIAAGIIVACESFFVYRRFIFRRQRA
ncbi:MAG: GtrA family protein [Candidatus Taylorbacteria bacterium]|nr:GtrA family protein [Candidatus Taylorbacteria bacterium]